MTFVRALTLSLLVSACATGPEPKPTPPLPRRAAVPSGAPIVRVSAPAAPTTEEARIGKAELARARSLLSEARNELEPRQYELLDNKLTEAERAFGRFEEFAKATGRAAEVARGTEGLAEARSGSELGELTRVGPLLAFLVLLWPSSTRRDRRMTTARTGATRRRSSRSGCGRCRRRRDRCGRSSPPRARNPAWKRPRRTGRRGRTELSLTRTGSLNRASLKTRRANTTGPAAMDHSNPACPGGYVATTHAESIA